MSKQVALIGAAAIVAAIVVEGRVSPFVVIAKRDKWRGGRQWTAGMHEFLKEEQIAELGTAEEVAKMIEAIANDTLSFDIEYPGKPRPGSEEQQQA